MRELFSALEYEEARAPLTWRWARPSAAAGDGGSREDAHLLIAGTTGSGKSVALSTMILSLLYRMPPEHCRVIMIVRRCWNCPYTKIRIFSPRRHRRRGRRCPQMGGARDGGRYTKMANRRARRRRSTKRVGGQRKGEQLKRTVQTGFDRETGRPVYEDGFSNSNPCPSSSSWSMRWPI